MTREPPPQGYLLKRGRRLASWKRRCFCLCDSELFYYYTAEMSNPFQPLGVISLHEVSPSSLQASPHTALDSSPSPSSFAGNPIVLGAATVSAVSDCGLPHFFGFTVHTKQRVWHLATDTAVERDEWISVLCKAGAQLSLSSAEDPAPLAHMAWAWAETRPLAGIESAAEGRSGEVGGEDDGGDGGVERGGMEGVDSEMVVPFNGVLWKRASKVHIAQATEAESGLARDWVTRHFRLLPAEGMLLYFQKPDDVANAARGIVPLVCYDGVSEPPLGVAGDSTPEGLHAFQLSAWDGSPERAFVLAAASDEEKREWMDRLRGFFARTERAAVAVTQQETNLY